METVITLTVVCWLNATYTDVTGKPNWVAQDLWTVRAVNIVDTMISQGLDASCK